MISIVGHLKYFKINGVLLSGTKKIKKSSGVLLSGSGVLLSRTGAPLSGNGVLLSDIFKNIYCWSSYVFGVLLSLGFYCRVNIHFLKILKKLGFYCRWSSSVFGVLLSASPKFPDGWKRVSSFFMP